MPTRGAAARLPASDAVASNRSAYGRFQRVVPLPAEVGAERDEASYRQGVPIIELPKAGASRRRTIEVAAG